MCVWDFNSQTVEPTTHLEKRVPGDNLKEPLEALAPRINDVVREAIGEDLARKRWDVDLKGVSGTALHLARECTYHMGNRRRTRVDSRSSVSRNASKSEYRRRTTEWRSLKAGILVWEGEVARFPDETTMRARATQETG